MLAVFADPAAAVTAADRVHRVLDAHPFEPGMAVRARIGIHTGPAWPQDGTYVALTLNRTARVAATAHGGQTVVTGTTRARTAAGPRLLDLGSYWLRDFDEPVTLFQVGGPNSGPWPSFPALRVAVPTQGHGIDADLTSFRGREQELDDLLDLLHQQRVATVVGPGGAGKSRLAREVTRRLPPGRRDVRLVELGPLREPAAVPGALAAAVGLKLENDRPPGDSLIDHLRHAEVILVFDNCEHMSQSVGRLVANLVGACPGVRVLATSRAPLQIPGEYALRLPPLADDAVVQLFLDRAAGHGWRPEGAEEARIPDLCRHLDGLPLAVEMAAGWTTSLTLSDLTAVLVRAPAELASTAGGGSGDRHRSLSAVIEGSHQLLDPDEREALARLSVLRDRFDLPTAAAALGDLAPTTVAAAALVRRLVDRSLVMVGRHGERSVYHLHATVRSFAGARLTAGGGGPAVRRRLGRWFLEQLEARAHNRAWSVEVRTQGGNLAGVIDSLVDEDAAMAARLAQVVARQSWSAGDHGTTIEQLQAWAAALEQPTAEAQGLVGHVAFNLLCLRRNVEAAEWIRRHAALTAAVGAPDPSRPQEVLQAFLLLEADPAAAVARCRDLLAGDDAATLNDHGRLQAHWVASIGYMLLAERDRGERETALALEVAYRLDDHTAIALLSSNRILQRAARKGLASQARNLLHWSLHQYPMLDEGSYCTAVIDQAAWLAFDLGRHDDTARLLRSMDAAGDSAFYYEAGRSPDHLVRRLEAQAPEAWVMALATTPLGGAEALELAREVLRDPRLPPAEEEDAA